MEFENERILEELYSTLRKSGAEEVFPIIKRIFGSGIPLLGGKAPDIGKFNPSGGDYRGHINAIPSSLECDCARELLVLCFDKDNLNDRLRETIYHAGVYCRGKNKIVIFLTTKWNNQTYEKHRTAVNILEHEGVNFWFVLISDNGVTKLNI